MRQSTICWQATSSALGGSLFTLVASSLSSFGLNSVCKSCSNHSNPVSRQATTTSVMFSALVTNKCSSFSDLRLQSSVPAGDHHVSDVLGLGHQQMFLLLRST